MSQSSDDHDHPGVAPILDEVGDPADLLEASGDLTARRDSVLRRYRAGGPVDGHQPEHASVRTATHKGHEISIRTTYAVTIDGQPLQAHMEVGADGSVHYHALPNYATASAVDLIRQVIDSFPDDYPPIDSPGTAQGEV